MTALAATHGLKPRFRATILPRARLERGDKGLLEISYQRDQFNAKISVFQGK